MLSKKVTKKVTILLTLSILLYPTLSTCGNDREPGRLAKFVAIFTDNRVVKRLTNNCIVEKLKCKCIRRKLRENCITQKISKLFRKKANDVILKAPVIKVKKGWFAWAKGLLNFSRIKGFFKNLFNRKELQDENDRLRVELLSLRSKQDKEENLSEVLEKNKQISDNNEKQVRLLNQEKINLNSQITQLNIKIKELQKNLSIIEKSKNDTKEKSELLNVKKNNLQQNLSQKETKLTQMKQEIEKLKEENRKLQKEQKNIKAKLSDAYNYSDNMDALFNHELENLEKEKAEQEKNLYEFKNKLKENFKKYETEKKKLNSTISETKEKNINLEKLRQKAIKANNELQKEIKKTNKKLQLNKEKHEKASNKLQVKHLLDDMLNTVQIKHLNNEKNELKKIIDRNADEEKKIFEEAKKADEFLGANLENLKKQIEKGEKNTDKKRIFEKKNLTKNF